MDFHNNKKHEELWNKISKTRKKRKGLLRYWNISKRSK